MGMICTYTGKLIDLKDVKIEDICIRDIAHALSLICRFNGHTSKFYSVAEHCVLLSEAEGMPGTSLARLLHDAAETYVGDVSSPLKQLLPMYKMLEHRVEKLIAVKYDVDFSSVKSGDQAMLMLEASALMPRMFFLGTELKFPDLGSGVTKIEGWSPEVAERKFLNLAISLGVQH